MFTKEREYLDKLISAIDKLQSISYNDSKDTESKVVNATDDLIVIRDDMQSQIDQFDKWAEEESQKDFVDPEAGVYGLDPSKMTTSELLQEGFKEEQKQREKEEQLERFKEREQEEKAELERIAKEANEEENS